LTALDGGELSPALLSLAVGDHLLVDPRPQGFFTLKWVPPAEELWMIATGTGLAPFLSMLRTDEVWERSERIVLVHGVRESRHLTHADEIRALAEAHSDKLVEVGVVSREPAATGVVKGRIPAALGDGRLEAAAGLRLSLERSHLLLCGNPGMIDDVTQALEPRGFLRHRTRKPGHISSERYWEA
jgi:ferredoxin--NADP+ reductase